MATMDFVKQARSFIASKIADYGLGDRPQSPPIWMIWLHDELERGLFGQLHDEALEEAAMVLGAAKAAASNAEISLLGRLMDRIRALKTHPDHPTLSQQLTQCQVERDEVRVVVEKLQQEKTVGLAALSDAGQTLFMDFLQVADYLKRIRQERDAAPTNEAIRWQKRLHVLEGVCNEDASGTESGDPLDFTEACVRKALEKLRAKIEHLGVALSKAHEALNLSDSKGDRATYIQAPAERKDDVAVLDAHTTVARLKHELEEERALRRRGVAQMMAISSNTAGAVAEAARLRTRVAELEGALRRAQIIVSQVPTWDPADTENGARLKATLETFGGDLRALLTPAAPPEKAPAPRAPRCTCVHAPEQHGEDGCEVMTLLNGECRCEWDGQPASAVASRTYSEPPKMMVIRRAKAPPSPGDLANALQDRVHQDVGASRPAKVVKVLTSVARAEKAEARVRKLEDVLAQIRAKAAPIGYDSGDSGIVALVDSVLVPIGTVEK